MNIETLNNMGVINSYTDNRGIGTPVRMPYPESWKKEAEAEEQAPAPGKAIHLKSGGTALPATGARLRRMPL